MRRMMSRAISCAVACALAAGILCGVPAPGLRIARALAQSAAAPSDAIQNQSLPPPPNTSETKVLGNEAATPSPALPPAPEAPTATASPSVAAPTTWLPETQAQLTILDKIYGSMSQVTATVGTAFSARFLKVTVLACLTRPPNLPPDAAAFLQVTDSHAPAGSAAEFRGWVFKAEPALSGMSDAATDISVDGCS
jgi:hypothetical protein